MWVGLSAVVKGPDMLRAVLGAGLMVTHELSIPGLQISHRGAQRSLGGTVMAC